jgi:DNA-binding MarR family transcriptional regulator
VPFEFLSPIHKATRQIGIHLNERMDDLHLQGSEGHLLSYLRSYAPCPIAELHRVFGLKRSTLTSLLDRLEDRRLIRREPHPTDRRSVMVRLSARGRTLGDRVQATVADLEKRIRAEIREEDLHGFRRVLDAIGNVTQVRVKP